MTDIEIGCNGYDKLSAQDLQEMHDYCERYKDYLDRCKTERLCIAHSIELAEAAGFRPYEEGRTYRAGDKVYSVSREKKSFPRRHRPEEPCARREYQRGAHGFAAARR